MDLTGEKNEIVDAQVTLAPSVVPQYPEEQNSSYKLC